MYYTIGIETSARQGEVALTADDTIVGVRKFDSESSHSKEIMTNIAALLTEAEAVKNDINLIGVSVGPGAFTSLRIGVTCAKTLSYALGWKTVGVCSLEVLAQNICNSDSQIKMLCPLRDARRNAVYGRLFRKRPQRWAPCGEVMVKTPKEMARYIPEGALVFGSGVRKYPGIFEAAKFQMPESQGDMEQGCEEGRAANVAWLAKRYSDSGLRTDCYKLKPLYYRRTLVEEQLS